MSIVNNPKAILIINLSGKYGGAEKRYISLFNHIAAERDDYYLIINDALYHTCINCGMLANNNNIFILNLRKNSKNDKDNIQSAKKRKYIRNNLKSKHSCKIRNILGQTKYLIKQLWQWLCFTNQFIKIIKKNNMQLVYSVWFGGIWTWPLKKILGFTLIHSYNDSSLSSISKSLFRVLSSEYLVLKHCDKIDFLSRGIVPRLEKQIDQIDESRISISPNSFINYGNYYPDNSKENSVVFMSRLVKIKNPILFLKAIEIANLKYNMSNINYYILGTGPLENTIKNYILSNRIKNVYCKGEVNRPWEYLQKSKVFVSVQKDENYPSQSLLEAMACENAIIASDVGETRLLVTVGEGILVKLNEEEIAKALCKLFTTPCLIEKLGINARKKAVENHNIEKYVEYFYSITAGE